MEATEADTLVVVPDGPLRTIPIGALHDGTSFLVRKYATAITPGLDLTNPAPINRDDINILIAGLTRSVEGFPSLPYVSEEISRIHDLYGGRVLVDQEFLLTNLEKELRSGAFTMVHIASHAQFEREVDESFLLTFDGTLTLDRLDELIGLFRFRQDPLELLVLSACETAAGDVQAGLGLAGVAIKAGARSAVATLWHIEDPASSMIISEFYRKLQNPLVSRAAALQTAQLAVMEDARYEHPGYWAPFVLINNWL
jgi:CHAT domain-containing protein